MIVIAFRSRLKPGVEKRYGERAEQVYEWATRMPGYRSIKDFVAADGERLALIEFESSDELKAWAEHAGHRAAQQEGRDVFFADYRLQVCELLRQSDFEAGE